RLTLPDQATAVHGLDLEQGQGQQRVGQILGQLVLRHVRGLRVSLDGDLRLAERLVRGEHLIGGGQLGRRQRGGRRVRQVLGPLELRLPAASGEHDSNRRSCGDSAAYGGG